MPDTHRQDIPDPAASLSRIGFRAQEPGDESNRGTGARNTPVVTVDVDGVLAADPAQAGGPAALGAAGYRRHHFEGLAPDGAPAQGWVWLNPQHGPWLREVRDAGAQLVWATSWGPRAVEWIAPRLGLPDMPVIDVPNQPPGFGWSAKHGPIRHWIGGRPLAWLDDRFGGKEQGWAEDRRDHDGIPTLIVPVHPGRGLQRGHVDQLLAWLNTDVAEYGARTPR
jgi:hypothetical protein